jgi:hypothetical protein
VILLRDVKVAVSLADIQLVLAGGGWFRHAGGARMQLGIVGHYRLLDYRRNLDGTAQYGSDEMRFVLNSSCRKHSGADARVSLSLFRAYAATIEEIQASDDFLIE